MNTVSFLQREASQSPWVKRKKKRKRVGDLLLQEGRLKEFLITSFYDEVSRVRN